MNKITLLWSFQYKICILVEKGGKSYFHFPYHLDFIWQLIANEVLNVGARMKTSLIQKLGVSWKDCFEGVL